jgi:hypothetical protein
VKVSLEAVEPLVQSPSAFTVTCTGPGSSMTNPSGGLVSKTEYVPYGKPSTHAVPSTPLVAVLVIGFCDPSGPVTLNSAPGSPTGGSPLVVFGMTMAPVGIGVSVNGVAGKFGGLGEPMVQSATVSTTTVTGPGLSVE